MKTTSIRNCQSCGKQFTDCDIVYFVPLDNNIVCPECAYKHDSREKRIVEGESSCSPATTHYNNITEAEIDANGKAMGDICCDECSYSTGYMDIKSAVFKVNMQGGYFMYDGEGGSESKCPVCGQDSLTTRD